MIEKKKMGFGANWYKNIIDFKEIKGRVWGQLCIWLLEWMFYDRKKKIGFGASCVFGLIKEFEKKIQGLDWKKNIKYFGKKR